MRCVTSPESTGGITRHRGRHRHIRQRVAIGPPELERPVGPACDLEALLVHRAMMSAAEDREVGQRRRAPVRPVAEMMALAEADVAARKPAAPVPSVERSP